ncbi:MAG: DUF1273 family protein [Clostridia bacterium]|nr:DUF1273 family protein [Clostridia bacterium]
MKNKSCFFTGHRIIPAAHRELLINQTRDAALWLIENRDITDFIAGGALGYDTLAEMLILRLRGQYPQIKLHLYLPCHNQTAKWNKADKALWQRIITNADSIRYITEGNYITGCMQLRNKAMVNDAQYGIVYLTHRRSGTYNTVELARSQGRVLALLPRAKH